MDAVWLNISTFLTIYTLAIVSPGPNFILVVNTALTDSRKAAIFTALGVATGSGLFGLAGLLGLIVIIHSLPYFAVLIRYVGSGYLVWLGLGMMWQSFRPRLLPIAAGPVGIGLTPRLAWRTGLLTNLTNPKAWAFYFALFTVVISPGFLLWHKALINSSMFLISFGWYALGAFLVSSPRFRPTFQGVQPLIRFVLGLLLIVLGGRMFVLFQ